MEDKRTTKARKMPPLVRASLTVGGEIPRSLFAVTLSWQELHRCGCPGQHVHRDFKTNVYFWGKN
jgi:hypothetical protein